MYTLAYDESSGFESFERNPRVPTIIAALMYNDYDKKIADTSETTVEQFRVMSYLWHICIDSNKQFPQALHVGWENSAILQKNAFNSLAEFLQRGTYKGKELVYLSKENKILTGKNLPEKCTDSIPLPRKGSYQLHTVFKTQRKISDFFSKGAVLKDNEASNTYINMVKILIRNAVFLNSDISFEYAPSVHFEFPTRIMPFDTVRNKREKKIYNQFYPIKESGENYQYQVIGNNDSLLFANIIDTYSKEFGGISIVGDLKPESIGRGYNAKDPKYRYAFRFLADIIVSYLKTNLHECISTNSRRTAESIISAYNEYNSDFGEDSDFIKEMIRKTIKIEQSFGQISFDAISPGKNNIKEDKTREWLQEIKMICKESERQYEEEFYSKKKPFIINVKSELESIVLSNTEEFLGTETLKGSIKRIDDALQKHKIPNRDSISSKHICHPHNKTKLVQLRNTLNQLNTIDDGAYFNEMNLRMQTLIGDGLHRIYCYDDIDYYYYQAASSINKGEYFNFYSNMYDCIAGSISGKTQPDSMIQTYYEEVLFKALEAKATSLISRDRLQKAVENLIYYRFSDNRSTGKLLFIFEKVYSLYNEFAKTNNSIGNLYLFRLCDVGMSAYTHAGDTKNALEFYHKCMDIKTGIPRDERKYTQNRLITIYNDLMDYKKAEELACEILEIEDVSSLSHAVQKQISAPVSQPAVTNIRCDITEPVIFKTASSLGQTYAFMNNDLAEVFFKEVLDNKENDPDRSITMSYCLHWYIESNQKDKYEKMAAQYFGGQNSLAEQLNYLIIEGTKPSGEAPFSMDYALFVFIKAFYRFYKDDFQNKKILKKLVSINNTLNTTLNKKNRHLKSFEMPVSLPYRTQGHPWEIIYKYSALMEKYIEEADNNNIEKSSLAVSRRRKGGIVDLVVKYGELEFAEDRALGNPRKEQCREDIEKQINELWLLVKQTDSIYSGWTENDGTIDFKRDQLTKMFSYMYH